MSHAQYDGDWWELHESLLRDFSNKIDGCVANSDWEELISVLRSRQTCLEDMFAKPVPEQYGKAIRSLVSEILDQDAMFQLKVQDQKTMLANQLAELKRSQFALHAYNNR